MVMPDAIPESPVPDSTKDQSRKKKRNQPNTSATTPTHNTEPSVDDMVLETP